MARGVVLALLLTGCAEIGLDGGFSGLAATGMVDDAMVRAHDECGRRGYEFGSDAFRHCIACVRQSLVQQ
ncbi:MAG: hypothetical protein K0S81_387 [Rhodospirillales bacterium]|nr:hypothetical protein [Rhodospirillales bacterium]